MGWSKYAIVAMILVIFFIIGLFGSYFGYRVEGAKVHTAMKAMKYAGYGDYYIVYYEDGTNETLTMDEIRKRIAESPSHDFAGFIYNLAMFNIEGVPYWLSGIFWIMVCLLLFIAITSFIPFLTSGG